MFAVTSGAAGQALMSGVRRSIALITATLSLAALSFASSPAAQADNCTRPGPSQTPICQVQRIPINFHNFTGETWLEFTIRRGGEGGARLEPNNSALNHGTTFKYAQLNVIVRDRVSATVFNSYFNTGNASRGCDVAVTRYEGRLHFGGWCS